MTLTIFCKLHLERIQTLLLFANVARAPYLNHDANGSPLPDGTRGMIFLRQAKIPGHLEDHIMAKTNGSRNFPISSMPSQRPMSQVSSSFPSYDDATTLSTTMGATMSTTNPTVPVRRAGVGLYAGEFPEGQNGIEQGFLERQERLEQG